MNWILRQFRRRSGDRAALVCYLRENGPIAYGTALFAREPRERAEAMLATGLTWYWKCTAAGTIARDWTELSRWSLAALLGDLVAEKDGVGAQVLAVAVDPRDSAEEITDARVAGWMRGFGGALARPLHAVVSHAAGAGDAPDLLFVAQQPPESIRSLLHGWGIDRDKAARRAYARLHGAALEDVIRSLQPRP